MLFLNTHIIAASNGQYEGRADQNLAELRSIMKGLIVRDRPQTTQANLWANETKTPLTASTTTTASTQTGGWLYPKKKKPSVKTFSLG